MMLKRMALLVFAGMLLVSLSGCASAGRRRNMEMQGLRNQISVLEAQIQSKDEEINSLKGGLSRSKEEVPSVVSEKKFVGETKSRPSVKQIQMALKNAGYNLGAVDGKMGKQTKSAIRAFQKANGIPADGKVGKHTWELLSKYLYKKIK
ncbi:MAG: peptidoglycan-binding domain-containing protein [Candidatus Omnitrophota bacterium]